MRGALVVSILIGLAAPTRAAPTRRRPLGEDAARRVALRSLSPAARALPGLDLEADPPTPRCWTFEVLWANPGPGSAHVAFVAIDRRTGDAWEPVLCTRARAGSLGVGPRELRRARAHPACC